jgi:hypothetical protein
MTTYPKGYITRKKLKMQQTSSISKEEQQESKGEF